MRFHVGKELDAREGSIVLNEIRKVALVTRIAGSSIYFEAEEILRIGPFGRFTGARICKCQRGYLMLVFDPRYWNWGVSGRTLPHLISKIHEVTMAGRVKRSLIEAGLLRVASRLVKPIKSKRSGINGRRPS